MQLKNILNINNPERYQYQVVGYTTSGSEFVVKLSYQDEILYLTFMRVEYIRGGDQWQGTKFEIAEEEDCVAVFRKLGTYKNLPESYPCVSCKLYRFISISGEVVFEIIAAHTMLSEDNQLFGIVEDVF